MPFLPFAGNDDPLHIKTAMWKFIPEQASLSAYQKYDTCNAKAEEIFEKRTYKTSIMESRGLVVLMGFFEGQEQPDKISQPYFIYPANGEILTLGCVFSDWMDRETGQEARTFAIITTPANVLMSEIHNKKKRMPLIVPSELREWWLGDLPEKEVKNYLCAYPDGYLTAHKVTRDIYKRGVETNLPQTLMPITA